MRWASRIRIICLLAILIGQSCLACIFPLPVAALDLDSMIQEGIKNQLPGANRFSGGNQFTGPTQQAPIKAERTTQRLEDLIQRQDIPYGYPPMIPLQGVTIAGLGPKAISSLGENYFVVRSNTNTLRMSDLYRENRTAGKANYVTMDCLIHPYLAFTNRVYAETIRKHLLPITKSLLNAMLKVALSDYKQADDSEVRADIECNIAFLSLAMKLIDSTFVVPAIGRLPQIVQDDFDAVISAKPGHSAIFGRNEDFSFYRPVGWYRSSPDLFTYYRVKAWLSRMYYPLNDVTYDSDGVKANNFRRSVLLYRCLDLARVDGKPAMESWMRLVKGMFVLGAQVENWQEKNLYAHDYKSVFKANSADLKMTLHTLSEPLYRTKLLLAVRKQKPLTLGSTSIFDLEEAKATKAVITAFKFIPCTGTPEEPWMRYAASLYPKPQLSTNVFPVALLDLNAWGAPQAANALLDSSWAMDESMPKTVSELKRWVLRRALAGQVQPVDCRIWNMLSPAWRLLPDGIQTALRSQMWATRRLETVFAAWLDSSMAIAPLPYFSAKPATENSLNKEQGQPKKASLGSGCTGAVRAVAGSIGASSAGATTANAASAGTNIARANIAGIASGISSSRVSGSRVSGSTVSGSAVSGSAVSGSAGTDFGGIGSASTDPVDVNNNLPGDKKVKPLLARRAARGHFLDPCPDFFNRILIDTQRIDKELMALGFPLDSNFKRGLDDYVRLFQRFFKIAKDEVEGKQLSPDDLSLLGNIDIILDKIDLPLPAVMNLEPQANSSAKATANDRDSSAGFTMALGRPGLLYLILLNKTTREWTLARGAVYTYYEQYGSTLTEDALLNKIDRGTIQAPYWAEHFDFVQADKK